MQQQTNLSFMPFGHYVRVLVYGEVTSDLRDKVQVERKGFAFFMDVESENFPDICTFCNCLGHHFDIFKRIPMMYKAQGNIEKQNIVRNKASQEPKLLYLQFFYNNISILN